MDPAHLWSDDVSSKQYTDVSCNTYHEWWNKSRHAGGVFLHTFQFAFTGFNAVVQFVAAICLIICQKKKKRRRRRRSKLKKNMNCHYDELHTIICKSWLIIKRIIQTAVFLLISRPPHAFFQFYLHCKSNISCNDTTYTPLQTYWAILVFDILRCHSNKFIL